MTMPSVTFIKGSTQYNTYTDWKLATEGNPIIALPTQKVQTVDIPGLNGVLDLSNSLRIGGGPIFNNREGSFSFIFLGIEYHDTTDWSTYIAERKRIYKEIVNIVHGQMLKVETTFEPGVIYTGRFSVGTFTEEGANLPKIEISYSLKPDPIN